MLHLQVCVVLENVRLANCRIFGVIFGFCSQILQVLVQKKRKMDFVVQQKHAISIADCHSMQYYGPPSCHGAQWPLSPCLSDGNIIRCSAECAQMHRSQTDRKTEKEGKGRKKRRRRLGLRGRRMPGWGGGKAKTKKEMESVCFEALSLFFFKPVTHVLLKGRSPDAGRQLDGDGQAFCMRSSPCARGCWRAISRE